MTDNRGWLDLPAELKVKCMHSMDYKTRSRLRGTSILNKDLVESKKYPFTDVKFKYDRLNSFFSVEASSEKGFEFYSSGIPFDSEDDGMTDLSTISRRGFDETIYCQLQILSRGTIETLTIDYKNPMRDDRDLMLFAADAVTSISTTNFHVNYEGELSIPLELLKKCDTQKLKNVIINYQAFGFSIPMRLDTRVAMGNAQLIPMFFETEQLKVARIVHFEPKIRKYCENITIDAFSECFVDHIEKWISEGRTASRLIIYRLRFRTIKQKLEENGILQQRIIPSENPETIKIRMDDETKVIEISHHARSDLRLTRFEIK